MKRFLSSNPRIIGENFFFYFLPVRRGVSESLAGFLSVIASFQLFVFAFCLLLLLLPSLLSSFPFFRKLSNNLIFHGQFADPSSYSFFFFLKPFKKMRSFHTHQAARITTLIHTSTATAVGGRAGSVKNSDGVIDVKLSLPTGFGGPGIQKGTTTPEDLFAAGYAACFGGAAGKK